MENRGHSNKYSKSDSRLVLAATAMGKGRTPFSFAYNDVFNSTSSAFIKMFQRAVFDGDIDGAVKTADGAVDARLKRR